MDDVDFDGLSRYLRKEYAGKVVSLYDVITSHSICENGSILTGWCHLMMIGGFAKKLVLVLEEIGTLEEVDQPKVSGFFDPYLKVT